MRVGGAEGRRTLFFVLFCYLFYYFFYISVFFDFIEMS